MSCVKAAKFMDARGTALAEQVSASKKLSKKDAEGLVRAATRVIVSKGNKVAEFVPGNDAMSAIVEAMLGPTGNLRAPTLRIGKVLLVGFNEDVYRRVLG